MAAFLVVTLLTVSTAFAQESSKSEESARETKEEIRSILSDIEKRHPSDAPVIIQPPLVSTVSAGGRMPWWPFLLLGVTLALGILGLVVFRVLRRRAKPSAA